MAEEDAKPLPTFAGRLRVADFMYEGGGGDGSSGDYPQTANPVRVLRSRSVSVLADSPAGSSRATKRKAEEDEEDASSLAAIPRRGTPASSQSPSPTKKAAAAAAAIRTSGGTSGGHRSRSSTPGGGRGRTRPTGYAPPAVYAHLPLLPDAIAPNLLVLFVGLNPGVETARSGHAYAHPSNLFWKLMHSSGVLPHLCSPQEDRTLPARFRLGLTNIVARPSRNGAELRAEELDEGVAVLEAKARRWRPEVMCMVGKGIWDSVVRVRARQGRRKPAFRYGWQDESENMGVIHPGDEEEDVADGVRVDPGWKGARVFVASSTSGLAATLRPAEKEAIWRQLGEQVQRRRKEIEEEKLKEEQEEK